MSQISLQGLNKGNVLAALYNASRPQGMGFLQYDPKPMTLEEAEYLLQRMTDFDYIKGRVMKVDLSGDVLDTWGYDRGNGDGAAEQAISELRSTGDVNSVVAQATHHMSTLEAAEDVKADLNKETTVANSEGIVILSLGLADVADVLGPAVDRAIEKRRA
ncbi:MAG: hypothetical protein HYV65_00180 [Candidatus Spechtbacteria bacterium]|nr:hypothetical protein [Candidatus Spechtbacteria bacterium]